MKTILVALLAVFLGAGVLHADDYSKLVKSCGKGSITLDVRAQVTTAAGQWRRTVSFRAGASDADTMMVSFLSHSKNGPWLYQSSMYQQMPCLAASGIVPVASQARVTPAVNSSSNDDFPATGITILLVGLCLYFFPAVVSGFRRCKAHNGICVVNLFLGWTFVGWVVALAWAASGESAPKAAQSA